MPDYSIQEPSLRFLQATTSLLTLCLPVVIPLGGLKRREVCEQMRKPGLPGRRMCMETSAVPLMHEELS